jgi:hypothetical protein
MTKANNKIRGVYFLADDRLLELGIAFLNSFRKYNPELPLCFIPYNDNVSEMVKLQEAYGFSVFDDRDLLKKYDDLSLSLHPYRFGHYRKLAIWEGVFDEFIYIDIDTVVLSSFDFVFEFLNTYDYIAASSNIPYTRKWVWKDSVFSGGDLSEEQINFAANTGFIASGKGALSLDDVYAGIPGAQKILSHMNLYCYEQPFLNYLVVTSGMRYTGLSVLSKQKEFAHLKKERWAGDKGGEVNRGRIRFGRDEAILFLHWAGEWQLYRKEKAVRTFIHKIFGGHKPFPATSWFMPYKKLWKYYRFLHKNT